MLEFVLLAVVLLEVALLVVELLPVDVSSIDFSVVPVLDELLLPPPRGVGAIDGKSDTVGNSVGAIDGKSGTVGASVGSIPSGKSVGASVSLPALDTECADERSKSAHGRKKSFMGAMVTVGFYSTLRLLSWPSVGMGVFFRTIALPATVRRGLVIEKNYRNARRMHLKSRLSNREGG